MMPKKRRKVCLEGRDPTTSTPWSPLLLTFSWLKESILFIAVSKAVTISRKAGSCSHRGLDRRSEEILTADLDMAGDNGSGEHAKESRKGQVSAAARSHNWLLHLQRAKIRDFNHQRGLSTTSQEDIQHRLREKKGRATNPFT